MESELLKIGEIAAFFHVSAKAIRLYEKKGIIKPIKIDSQTGYRYYSVDQVQQLNALLELKSMGFSLDEIKQILSGNISNEQLLKLFEHKKRAFLDLISSTQNKIEAIEDVSSRLTASHPSRDLPELTEEERAWLLVKMVCIEDLRGQSILSEALWL